MRPFLLSALCSCRRLPHPPRLSSAAWASYLSCRWWSGWTLAKITGCLEVAIRDRQTDRQAAALMIAPNALAESETCANAAGVGSSTQWGWRCDEMRGERALGLMKGAVVEVEVDGRVFFAMPELKLGCTLWQSSLREIVLGTGCSMQTNQTRLVFREGAMHQLE